MVLGLALYRIVIQTRRGRHIEALINLDVIGIVDADEITCIFTSESDAGCAMCLIAND